MPALVLPPPLSHSLLSLFQFKAPGGNCHRWYRMSGMRNFVLLLAGLLIVEVFGIVPAGKAFSQDASNVAPVTTDLKAVRRNSLSHVTLQTSSGPVAVYLYARDQEVSVLQAPYCGGNEGDKDSQGHYELISVRNGKITSQLRLDPGTFFVTEHPHDGLHIFTPPGNGQQLVKLYQYGSCNSESAEFYRLDPEGHLARVAFLAADGRRFLSQSTGPSGGVHSSGQGNSIFCSYNNFIGMMECDAYRYDGKNFIQTKSWMGSELPVVWKHPTPAAQAQRALYDFLSALDSKNYQAAAFYYAGPSSAGARQAESPPLEASEWLAAYCGTAGCPIPVEIANPSPSGSDDEMEFMVSFGASDFTSVQTKGKSKVRFRVKRLANGFKVSGLPPHAPPAGEQRN